MNNTNKALPLVMWLLSVSFFAYQFILRLWPGLMIQPIMQQFMIGATSFGFMASLYYYGYALMQMPIAILLEKYGARVIIFVCATVCGVATFCFTYTDDWTVACISRFLIGAASAAGFLGVSKVISGWFSKKSYTKMVGFSFSLGLIGAVYGGAPVGMLVKNNGWHNVASSLALVSIIIGVLVLLFMRKQKQNKAEEVEGDVNIRSLLRILSLPSIWLVAIANLLMVGSLEGFADVWGVQYLMTAFDFTKVKAAEFTSFIFIGMIFGGPILAYFSSKFSTYSVITACGVGMCLLVLFMLTPSLYTPLAYMPQIVMLSVLRLIFFLIGMMCCYQVLIFATGSELVESKLLGVTIAFLNCINMLGGSFFHTAIGILMDMYWTGNLNTDGTKSYTAETFQSALQVIPVCSLVGGVIIIYVYLRQKMKQNN